MEKNKNFITAVAIILLLVIVGLWYVVASRAATSNIITTSGPGFGVYVNPQSANMTVGSTITVDVLANLGTNSVQTISAYLRFDPTLLRLDSVSQTGVSQDYTVATRCSSLDGCKPAGQAVLIVGKSGSGVINPANGVLIGKLTFTALQTGIANVALDPDPKLSGFTSTSLSEANLNSRQISNGTYTITRSKGKKR